MTAAPDDRDLVLDPGRLAAVRATGLLDTGAEAAFDHLTRVAARALDVPYAFVTIVDDKRSFWKSCYGIGSTDPADRQNTVEESFCQYVVRSDAPLVVGDAPHHPVTSDNPSIESMGVQAWAGWPIRSADGHVLGTFCAVDIETREWSDDATELLALMADAAANEIRLRIAAEDAEAEAARLRATLLPPVLPAIPGFRVAAIHRSAEGPGQVLGDFYDVLLSGRQRWHAVLGDVCGSGVEAAAVAALVRWSYHALADVGDEPGDIFAGVNELLLRHSNGRFVTGQAVSFDADTGGGRRRLRFASAGHHPALIRRASGAVEEVVANGWMLGAFADLRIGATDLELDPGDQLVLFTDGLTEIGRDGERGHDAVRSLLAGLPEASADEVARSLAALVEVDGAEAHRDDTAILVLEPVDLRP